MKFGKVDYDSTIPPTLYKCSRCHCGGVKLWREYNVLADYTELFCANCAMKEEKKKGQVGDNGLRESEYGRTDQIGSLIPAVPVPEGNTYWGYTSVPDDGVAWWKHLPTYQSVEAK